MFRSVECPNDYYLWAMMKYAASLLSFLLLYFVDNSAQVPGTDTLFSANELIYFSDLEEISFLNYLAGKPDYLTMIAAVNPRTDQRELELYRDWIDEILSNIRVKKFERMNEEKKIERIQKYIGKSLLLSYEYKADFDDLFRSGQYNYFTAASLYAFVLDRLQIPYEIYEMSNYIYLIAYPGDRNIGIETTRPGYRYFMFDHETRTDFVEFIHNRGVVDDMTYRNTSTRDLFQQYYFADYPLTIREMIGMLYLNSALDRMAVNRPDESFAQLEKAFILYPSYKCQYLLLLELNNYLVTREYRNPLYLGYLIKASRLIGYGMDRETIENYLKDIVNTVLVREEDDEDFEFIYDYLQKYLRDGELKRELSYLYLYESGRMEFNNTRYGKALDFLEPAFQIHPEDERVRDLLARSLGGYSLMVSPSLVLEKIRHYDTAFTAVTGEGIYLMVKIRTALSLCGEAFQMQNGHAGEKYMAEFEKLMDRNPEAGVDNLLVGRSYSSAAIYYYREGMISRSREVLEKGLYYAPDNIELKLKLRSFQ